MCISTLLDCRLDTESMSVTSVLRRSVSEMIMLRSAFLFSGLSPEMSIIFSAYERIMVRGVLRSCETLAMISR